MSQSPVTEQQIAGAAGTESVFRSRLARLNRLLRDGWSFSGRERNCAFLNTGGGRFATISALTGFDFPDDARAIAVTDWDGDGDMDVWLTNRTAPRLRLLRNDLPAGRPWVALRLQGTRGNRDAIGARVELVLKKSGRRLVRAVRAGEGYLSQSSKELLIGFGGDSVPGDPPNGPDSIERLTVRWPGGATETFTGVTAGARWILREGSRVARPARARVPAAELKAGAIEAGPKGDPGGAWLTSRLPLPELPLESPDGRPFVLPPGKPVFLSFWPRWSDETARALAELVDSTGFFERAGVAVVVVSASDDPPPVSVPFPIVRPLEPTVKLFEQAAFSPFLVHAELTSPIGFLFDRRFQLAAMFRDPMRRDALSERLPRLRLEGDALRESVLPFAGKWIDVPRPPPVIIFAQELLNAGRVEEALSYTRAWRPRMEDHVEYSTLMVWLGDQLIDRGTSSAGMAAYFAALRKDPKHVPALNNLAWHLAAGKETAARRPDEALRLATRAATLTEHKDANVLDTLATAQLSAGKVDAARATLREAIEIARASNQTDLLTGLESALQQLEEATPRNESQ